MYKNSSDIQRKLNRGAFCTILSALDGSGTLPEEKGLCPAWRLIRKVGLGYLEETTLGKGDKEVEAVPAQPKRKEKKVSTFSTGESVKTGFSTSHKGEKKRDQGPTCEPAGRIRAASPRKGKGPRLSKPPVGTRGPDGKVITNHPVINGVMGIDLKCTLPRYMCLKRQAKGDPACKMHIPDLSC